MTSTEQPWTIGRLLTWTVEYLGNHDSDNPRLDAEVLLAEARGCKRIELYTAYGEQASDEIRTTFRELVRRRAEWTPVAYLVGRREFFSLDFEVNQDVLIPRPETELLVVALLDYVKNRGPKVDVIEIADVGTGSGILAICAAKYIPSAHVTAIDISPAALAVARRNAERHKVVGSIDFIEGNILLSLPAERLCDFIVSNPPYIKSTEMEQLGRDVRDYEPKLALHGGELGIDVIAPLIEQASTRLKAGGVLLIEVSPMIASEVEQLISKQPAFKLGSTIRDLAGHARIVQAIKN